MKLLLFEWLHGGGLWQDGVGPDGTCPIHQQGTAMLQCLGLDLASSGVDLVIPYDLRLKPARLPGAELLGIDSASSLQKCLQAQAEKVDNIILIAPESRGNLLRACRWFASHDQKLVSPDLSFIRLTSDKQATADWLGKRNVRVPAGYPLSQWLRSENAIPLPAVIKPMVGAGSDSVELIHDWESFRPPEDSQNWRIEPFIAGCPVSVSVLCGPGSFKVLAPTGQRFDRDPFGHYDTAEYPLQQEIADRATELANKTMAVLPATKGYIGIDMVISELGQEQDCVIEINPRLTMSYLKLREIYDYRLARQMLDIARGPGRLPNWQLDP